ncbi:MAG: HEAT repeat domain-containing protein [Bacteroidales bacterium]|nr:HEAT repeat domain-containing protein [Bacteroidales bacterium]
MKNKDCNSIKGLFIDFADKNLDEKLTLVVREHIASCSSCRHELDALSEVISGLTTMADVEPPSGMKERFLSKLKEEKVRTSRERDGLRKVWLYNPFSQIAAGLAILLTGVLLGIVLGMPSSKNHNDIVELRNELDATKQMLFMSKLDQSSASQRIQAVNLIQDFPQPGDNILSALIQTMNGDDNVNVRIAAVYALAQFNSSRLVRDALAESLSLQKDPLVQITLINVLVQIREEKAKGPIMDILQKKETIDAVKQMAEKGLATFI